MSAVSPCSSCPTAPLACITWNRRALRVKRVRDGDLDAAFVRGAGQSPGLELIPVWRDELVVALPAAHPPAVRRRIEIAEPAAWSLRTGPSQDLPAPGRSLPRSGT
ncbi:LysR substrate-binding domain-containing protein [Spirillospora sp. CA-142024]|uniref:LysR substrate-binding domain-containing protein n=1 Tax=Spirillospora sp. CA-142024 TaxID=3240036 RepID=UPI003D950340